MMWCVVGLPAPVDIPDAKVIGIAYPDPPLPPAPPPSSDDATAPDEEGSDVPLVPSVFVPVMETRASS